MSAKTQKLPVRVIQTAGMQMRADMSGSTVTLYRDHIKNGIKLPPIEVVFDEKKYWLWDGFHRIAAYHEEGITEVECVVTEGTRSMAEDKACGANSDHGLQLTAKDRETAIVFQLKKRPDATDAEIAEICKVHATTVGRHRKKLEKSGSLDKKQTKTEKAAKALQDPANADKSNKEIAEEIGVSESTVENAQNAAMQDSGEEVKDALGNVLPEGIVEAFTEEFGSDMLRRLKRLHSDLKGMYDELEPATRFVTYNSIKADFANLRRRLEMFVPYCLCPICEGEGCKLCKETGWLPKFTYDTAVEKGDKWDD